MHARRGEITISLSNVCILHISFFFFIKISRQQLTDQLTQHLKKELLIRSYLLARYGSQLNVLNENHKIHEKVFLTAVNLSHKFYSHTKWNS